MPGLAGVVDNLDNLIGPDTFAWYSDYDGVQATSWTITVTKDGKGGALKFKIDAAYAASPVTYTLTVDSTEGVSGTPGAVTCDVATCTYSYDAGTDIALAITQWYPSGAPGWFSSGCTTFTDDVVTGQPQGCLVTLSSADTVGTTGT
jgi:hypothetical protein